MRTLLQTSRKCPAQTIHGRSSRAASRFVGRLVPAFGLGILLWTPSIDAVELLHHDDLPPGLLYHSGPGDTSPAFIRDVVNDPLGAFAGSAYQHVHTGTVKNGGQTYGGAVFMMPPAYLNQPTPRAYQLSFALKGLSGSQFDLRISNQDGLGQENSLSHAVTVDNGVWRHYEYSTVMSGDPLPNTWPDIPRNRLYFWTDDIHGGINKTFLIDAVRLLEFHAADFDEDGDVDGEDFLIWQSGFGQFPDGGAPHQQGDATGDGVVDGEDFLIWQGAFGDEPGRGNVASTPEPSAVALLAIAIATVASSRRSSSTRLAAVHRT